MCNCFPVSGKRLALYLCLIHWVYINIHIYVYVYCSFLYTFLAMSWTMYLRSTTTRKSLSQLGLRPLDYVAAVYCTTTGLCTCGLRPTDHYCKYVLKFSGQLFKLIACMLSVSWVISWPCQRFFQMNWL